ncbi:MAG: hypothetical protein FJ298_16155, partial [Planctomycetes bacterium]|nr:hypothetical protein [Planctomycetota bacterium]
ARRGASSGSGGQRGARVPHDGHARPHPPCERARVARELDRAVRRLRRLNSSRESGVLFVAGRPPRGPNRVIRGGSWNNNSNNCRSAIRNNNDPGNTNNNIGFRVVLAPALAPARREVVTTRTGGRSGSARAVSSAVGRRAWAGARRVGGTLTRASRPWRSARTLRFGAVQGRAWGRRGSAGGCSRASRRSSRLGTC